MAAVKERNKKKHTRSGQYRRTNVTITVQSRQNCTKHYKGTIFMCKQVTTEYKSHPS